MPINLDLTAMLDLPEQPDVVSKTGRFYGHLPDVAPYAYLHRIFVPTDADVLRDSAKQFDIPQVWQEFLRFQNGAHLFSNALYLDGVRAPGQLLDRSDYHCVVAFSLADANNDRLMRSFPDWLCVGGYGFDGSRVLLNRESLRVMVVEDKSGNHMMEWPSIASYFAEEIPRLSGLCDAGGAAMLNGQLSVPRKLHVV